MHNLVKVPRPPVMVCLRCPLCCNLLVEATTISECLHTFCRNCIYKKLDDGENDCCPICNANLGCLPIEKLRPDRQIDDVRMRLFPLKESKERRSYVDAHIPTRIKERTLSSLGIGGTQPSGNPGFASRKTKAISRRSAALNTSLEDEYITDSKTERTLSEEKNETEVNTLEEANPVDIKSRAAKEEDESKGKVSVFVRKKRLVKEESPCAISVRRTPLPINSEILTNDGNSLSTHLAERPTISANGSANSHLPYKMDQPSSFASCQDDTQPAFVKPVSDRSESLNDFGDLSTLAHLAEVAIDHANELESPRKTSLSHLTGSHPKRSRQKRGKVERDIGKAAVFPIPDESLHPPLDLHSEHPPSAERVLTSLDKQPVLTEKPLAAAKEPAKPVFSMTEEAGFWFCLQASENQAGENALPQISARYIRMKYARDGKLPVLYVKKYLVKKLDLQSESEVEITCHGQPLVPVLPLESIRGIWFSTFQPSRFSLAKKCDGSTDKNTTSLAQVSGKDCIMVLTYGRSRRLLHNQ